MSYTVSVSIEDVAPELIVDIEEVSQIITVEFADEAINGAPPGGAVGQVLAKASSVDYDFVWASPDGTVEIKNEIPTGAINGVNATFIAAFAFIPETLILFVNGLRQSINIDFVNIDDQTILLNSSPFPGDSLLIDYTRA